MRVRSALIIIGLCAPIGLGQIVTNGSFENRTITLPDGRVDIGNLTDWTAFGGQMLHERGVNAVSQLAAHEGNQFVSMGHNGASGDRLSQILTTVPGNLYMATFYLACIQGDELQTVIGSARGGGSVLGSTNGIVSSRSQGWVQFNFQFVANSAQTELRFEHTVGAGSANVAIDDVSVIPAPGAVALIGAAGLLALRRRR